MYGTAKFWNTQLISLWEAKRIVCTQKFQHVSEYMLRYLIPSGKPNAQGGWMSGNQRAHHKIDEPLWTPASRKWFKKFYQTISQHKWCPASPRTSQWRQALQGLRHAGWAVRLGLDGKTMFQNFAVPYHYIPWLFILFFFYFLC